MALPGLAARNRPAGGAMHFDFTPKMNDDRDRVSAFMDQHIYPQEDRFIHEVNQGDRWQQTAVVEELKPLARAAGLWNLFLPDSPHGAGLTNLEYAPLAELMGRVEWASEVFNSSAPDTGNMETIERYGNDAQKAQVHRSMIGKLELAKHA